MAVSPNGHFVVSGSLDGLIEVWDVEKGAIKSDLAYQKEGKFMAHSKSVLSLAFSDDSEYLASGDMEGTIKVWRISTGGLLRRFVNAHENGVTSLCFSSNKQQICSASYDGSVRWRRESGLRGRIHGLKSGKTLKTMRGHSSYVNYAAFTIDEQHVVSASSDGTVKYWDVSTSGCLATLKPAKIAESYADISVGVRRGSDV